MKINEIRIGCSFQLENGTLGGGIATIGHIKDIVTASELLESGSLSPIPLTEEWLLKLGFERLPNTMTYNYSSKCGSVSVFKMPNGNFFADGFIKDVRLKSVHQLQNLYFALTGEELSC